MMKPSLRGVRVGRGVSQGAAESEDKRVRLSLDRGSPVRSVRSDTGERWWFSVRTRPLFFKILKGQKLKLA
jgi:hypothetical protein